MVSLLTSITHAEVVKNYKKKTIRGNAPRRCKKIKKKFLFEVVINFVFGKDRVKR